MLARPPRLSDLADDTITRLTIWLRDVKQLHSRTCNDRRGRINSLWRWLADRGLCAKRPTNCPLDVPSRTPRAWTRDELSRLIHACAAAPGTICSLPASVWWLAFHALAWDTGARTTEILSFRWEWIDASGWLSVPADARKARRKDAVYRLQPDTLAILAPISRPVGLVLGWTLHRSRFWQLYHELLSSAELPNTRYDKPQRLRRSHASWLASAHGDATASLGHSDARTTRESYLDPRICQPPASGLLPFRILGVDSEDG